MAAIGPLGEVTCVRRDSFVVSAPDGDVSPGGDLGFYVRDTRFLDRIELRVDGAAARPLTGGLTDADRAVFYAYVPASVDHEIDATVLVTRRRIVDGGLHEEVIFDNAAAQDLTLDVQIEVGTDFAYIFDVKHGRTLMQAAASATHGSLVFRRSGGDEEARVEVYVDDVRRITDRQDDDRPGVIRVPLLVPARGSTRVCVDVTATDVYEQTPPRQRCEGFARPLPAARRPHLPDVRCSDRQFERLLHHALDDLEGLALQDPDAPADRFAAAGSPWFLTLFGRDSLWAALMSLPFDPDLALGTLRTLARRQGRRLDRDTEEAPGKILHEVRRGALVERGDLPPHYYGSIDATPLFVVLAHEAWRWGAARTDLEPLIPNVEAALRWMIDYGDADGDGFLVYARQGARGLANQGWKDSGDGIRFADGSIASAPLALAEVQGYAYAAAEGGAQLLDAFGRPGAPMWRDWAAQLAGRFRERFWVQDDRGPYPAIALDADKRPVDAVASNMGHLLFTGILDTAESALVAERLGATDMASGWGLRTMSAEAGGYNPLSYHCGSVWPHDTAIAVWGLARSGQDAAAIELLHGLGRAAPAFGYRLPELFAGVAASAAPGPVPYPTACRPQAWAAAGALLLVRAALGLEPDVPSGRLHLTPLDPQPFERLTLRGIRLGPDTSLDVEWNGELVVTWHGTPLAADLASAAPAPRGA